MLTVENSTEHSMLYSFIDPIKEDSEANVPYRQHAIGKYGRVYGNLSSDILNMYLLCMGEDFQVKLIINQLFRN